MMQSSVMLLNISLLLYDKDMSSPLLQKLAEMIIAGPEQAGYETGIWTGPLVADLIKRRFSIDYSASQVRRIVHQLEFSVQFPK
jgi:transposase